MERQLERLAAANHVRPPRVEEVEVRNQQRPKRFATWVRRVLVLVAGTLGMLGLLVTQAYAGKRMQHCEPLRRR